MGTAGLNEHYKCYSSVSSSVTPSEELLYLSWHILFSWCSQQRSAVITCFGKKYFFIKLDWKNSVYHRLIVIFKDTRVCTFDLIRLRSCPASVFQVLGSADGLNTWSAMFVRFHLGGKRCGLWWSLSLKTNKHRSSTDSFQIYYWELPHSEESPHAVTKFNTLIHISIKLMWSYQWQECMVLELVLLQHGKPLWI